MPKLGSAGTIHVSIVKRKRKDGSLYVQEVKSQYNPKTHLNIESTRGKTLGEVGIPTSIALRFKT